MTKKNLDEPPTVSVVILNYNGLVHLETCLSSLKKTNFKDFETLLVDNCSRDDSVQFVKKRFSWVKVLEQKVNLGFTGGNNVGISAASGKYIVLLNNDTEVDPDWLRELIDIAEQDESIGVCQSKICSFDDHLLIVSAGGRCTFLGYAADMAAQEVDDGRYNTPREIFYACGAAMLLRKKALNEVGLFDPKYFLYYEDVDLCWRMHLFGYRVVYVPSSVVYHKVGGSRLGPAKLYNAERNMTRTLLKNYQSSTLIKILPIYAAHKVKLGWTHLMNGEPERSKAVVRGLFWNLQNLQDTVRERRKIQAGRIISDQQIFKKMYWPGIKVLR